MRVEVEVGSRDGGARTGVAHTARGAIELPTFMPVGTRGTIRALSTHELAGLRSGGGERVEVLLANNYHLMLRPGAEAVADLGGLHAFSGWDGHMLTDSGGYQVFSLAARCRLDDDGVDFQSHVDGSSHRLTAAGAVTAQAGFGVDVAMVLDECLPYPAEPARAESSVERTVRWAFAGLDRGISRDQPDECARALRDAHAFSAASRTPPIRGSSARCPT